MASAVAAFADSPAIRSIDVRVLLEKDGTALVTEQWDVRVTSGTEWYLNRENLSDIEIFDLKVVDEKGREFRNVGKWDVDWSRNKKEGLCGTVYKRNGVELCWGVGEYGDHFYTVSYRMTNAVKSLRDYDMVHLQLISPGLSSTPRQVKVSVRPDCFTADTTNTRFWGFGYYGSTYLKDGTIVLESQGNYSANSSVILLARFNKGYFNSPSIQDRAFSEVLDTAMVGADFGDSEEEELPLWAFIASILAAVAAITGLVVLIDRANKKSILGMQPKEVNWCRNIPFGGDILSSEYVLQRLGDSRKSNAFAGALILKMIYSGALSVSKDTDGKIEIAFNDREKVPADNVSRKLYDMMVRASGSDRILQDKEFSRWSKRNIDEVNKWVMSISEEAKDRLVGSGEISASARFKPEGQAKAREVVGFKKFLQDFTLISERGTEELPLWREYLIFGSLYGIAELVAKQLKDINPQLFEQAMIYDYPTMRQVVFMSNNLGRAITNAQQAAIAKNSSQGLGGTSSFGGGGGFSGGGFGGGSR